MRFSIILLVVCSLFLSSRKPATGVTLKQIGQKDLLFSIRGFDYFLGKAYVVDYNAALNKVDLTTGEVTRLGKAVYANAKFIFLLNMKIYIISTDGSLDEIDPETGEWKTLTRMKVWSRVERIQVVRNTLYSIENGSLYFHRTADYDNKIQRGGNDFYNPGFLVRGQSALYSIQDEGSLYEINLADGSWKKLSKNKLWKSTKAAAVLGNKLYSVDNAGMLYETSLIDGTKTTLDEKQLVDTKYLFADAGKLYAVMVGGNLYEVQLGETKPQ